MGYEIIDETIKNPIVSVAMLTYGHIDYIKQAIESVLIQETNFPIQLVIAEDCSPDNTREIVKEYQKKYPHIIKLILQDVNVGAIENNHVLLENLDGYYIAPLEGDDYWSDSKKLQQQVDFLEQNLEYNLIYTDARYFTQKTQKFDLQRTQQISGFDDLLVKNRIFTLTTCFRREVLDSYLKEDYENLKTLPFGDYSLWLHATIHGKAKYLPIVSSVYRILEESASHSKDINRIVDFEEKINTCRMYYLNKYYTGDKEQLKKKLLGSKTLSIVRLTLLNENEEVFQKYKGDLKYIANYKYKYYLIYSLGKINFKIFVKIYNALRKK
ncbi:MAG: glycosyltransferase [Flavobacteriaceae bacterium]|jgi:glycosyltransferase involved in cell wall biosynthesis|nr:glycosyltransferase [Flavobacteriaceae bacterium]